MGKLSGKTALVTGASRGIGRGIAERLAADGAKVAVNYASRADAAAEVVAAITARGGQAFAVQGDVGTAAGREALFAGLDAGLAGAKLDILVNNAGISIFGMVANTTPDVFDRLVDVNMKGPFYVTQNAIPRLANGGRVINISSLVIERPPPFAVVYSMTKAALHTMSQSLSQELGPRGITVNSIGPGFVETDMGAELGNMPGVREQFVAITNLGRLGTTADIADAVAFLASDDARWVTAQYIGVHGGCRS
jgi:3-oxoacyl-[acyl-carrier protein] reductase